MDGTPLSFLLNTFLYHMKSEEKKLKDGSWNKECIF